MRLQDLEQWLREEGLDVSFRKEEEDVLLVFLGLDDFGERTLQIRLDLQISEEEHPPIRIEYLLPFSLEVQPQVAADIASAVCFLNSELGLPGFEFLEGEGKARFRHVVLMGQEGATKSAVLATIGWITAQSDLFTPLLFTIAQGEKTFDDVLKETLDSMK